MSALGLKQTFAAHKPISAKCPNRTFAYSINSSVRSRNASPIFRPSVLAVVRVLPGQLESSQREAEMPIVHRPTRRKGRAGRKSPPAAESHTCG